MWIGRRHGGADLSIRGWLSARGLDTVASDVSVPVGLAGCCQFPLADDLKKESFSCGTCFLRVFGQ